MDMQPQAPQQPAAVPVSPTVKTATPVLPSQNNRVWIFVMVVVYLFAIFVLYTMKATAGTILGFIVVSLSIVIILWFIITKILEKSHSDMEETTVPIINNRKAEEIIENLKNEKGILTREISMAHSHIVKPEIPEQTPTYFYYQVVIDDISGLYYMIYVDKKNVDNFGVEHKNTPYKIEDIKEVLEDASESTREYMPMTKEIVDSSGRTVAIETTVAKPVYRFPKQEARIGE